MNASYEKRERVPSTPSTDISKEHDLEYDDAGFKRATRLRRNFAFSASFSYVLAWIFLILVCFFLFLRMMIPVSGCI